MQKITPNTSNSRTNKQNKDKNMKPYLTAFDLIFGGLNNNPALTQMAASKDSSVFDVGAEHARSIGKQMIRLALYDGSKLEDADTLAGDVLTTRGGELTVDNKKVEALRERFISEATDFIDGFMKEFPMEMVRSLNFQLIVKEAIDSGDVIAPGVQSVQPEEHQHYIVEYEVNGKTKQLKWRARGPRGKVIGEILSQPVFKEYDATGNIKDFINESGVVEGDHKDYGHWRVSTVRAHAQKR